MLHLLLMITWKAGHYLPSKPIALEEVLGKSSTNSLCWPLFANFSKVFQEREKRKQELSGL